MPPIGRPALLLIPVCAALSLFLLQARAESQDQRRKLALLIGIESYSETSDEWPDLEGSRNDVELVESVLVEKFGFERESIVKLVDLEATRAAIVRAFENLIESAQAGDLVYIHYSGHGSQVPDTSGDETRGFDSTFVPIDAREEAVFEILDDEVHGWLNRLRAKTQDVVFAVDACHSGTPTRSGAGRQSRGLTSQDTRSYDWAQSLDVPDEPDNDRFVRVSACLDMQVAKEWEAPDGRIYGMFTWYWTQALLDARPNQSYRELMEIVRARMYEERQDLQHPQIEGADGLAVLRGEMADPSEYLVVKQVQGQQVLLQGGALHRVTVGSTYEVVEQDTFASSGQTTLKITNVRSTESTAHILAGPTPQTGDQCKEVSRAHPFEPLRVYVWADGSDIGEAALEVERSLARLEDVLLVPADRRPELILRVFAGPKGHPLAELLDMDEKPYGGRTLRPEFQRVAVDDRDSRAQLVENLDKLRRLRDLQMIVRSSMGQKPDVTVEMVVVDAATRPDDCVPPRGVCPDNPVFDETDCARVEAQLGARDVRVRMPAAQRVSFRIQNASDNPVFAYLFNIDPSGSVTCGFPSQRGNGDPQVWIDASVCMNGVFLLQDPGLIDSYIWLITDQPFDPQILQETALRGAAKRSSMSELEQLLSRVARGTRGGGHSTSGESDLCARRVYVDVVAE